MQFQADLLEVPVIRPKVTETTSWGAACLAGLAVAMWKSKEDLAALWQAEQRFEPSMAKPKKEALLAGWKKALERSKGWVS
jgi:glycerol kinase